MGERTADLFCGGRFPHAYPKGLRLTIWRLRAVHSRHWRLAGDNHAAIGRETDAPERVARRRRLAQLFTLLDVPNPDRSIEPDGSGRPAGRRKGDVENDSRMFPKIHQEDARCRLPELDLSIPASGNDQQSIRGKDRTRNVVAMRLIGLKDCRLRTESGAPHTDG